MGQRLFTFTLIFLVWIVFAGRLTSDVFIIGIIASMLTTFLFGNMIFAGSSRRLSLGELLKKASLIILFIPVFFYEAVKSALEVSLLVFKKNPSYAPGIVRVRTRLKNITAITILANLITLTPGTLSLDFDREEEAYYIHWINVKTRQEAETRKEIIERFERWLGVIFK